MVNIYLTEPDLIEHRTRIVTARSDEDGCLFVTLGENILRPPCGGQPQDHGLLRTERGDAIVGRVFEAESETWLEIDSPLAGPLDEGAEVKVVLDAVRRRNLSRCHSLIHLAAAAAGDLLLGYENKGSIIDEDASHVRMYFRSDDPPSPEILRQIDIRIRRQIHRNIPIRIGHVRFAVEAKRRSDKLKINPGAPLYYSIQTVRIEGIDTNTCFGSHVSGTSEIGPFTMDGFRTDGRGIRILSFRHTDTWMYWYGPD